MDWTQDNSIDGSWDRTEQYVILTYLHSDVYVGCDVFSYLGRFDLLVSFGIKDNVDRESERVRETRHRIRKQDTQDARCKMRDARVQARNGDRVVVVYSK